MPCVVQADRDRDAIASFGVFDRVVDQRVDGDPEAFLVCYHHAVPAHVQRPGPFRRWFPPLEGLLGEPTQVHRAGP